MTAAWNASRTATREIAWPSLLVRVGLITSGALLPLVGVVLLLRRLAGELQPLPPLALLLTGVLLTGFALVWRWLATRSGMLVNWENGSTIRQFWPTITLAIFAMTLSMGGTPHLALLVFWLLLLTEEGISAQRWWTRPIAPAMAQIATEEEVEDAEEEQLLADDVSQQITRTRSAAGEESLACLLRIAFAAGEQTQVAHVAFCPPLEGELTTQCEQLSGPPCEIRPPLVETFGSRLEIKRRGAIQLADEALVLLTVTATGTVAD